MINLDQLKNKQRMVKVFQLVLSCDASCNLEKVTVIHDIRRQELQIDDKTYISSLLVQYFHKYCNMNPRKNNVLRKFTCCFMLSKCTTRKI